MAVCSRKKEERPLFFFFTQSYTIMRSTNGNGNKDELWSCIKISYIDKWSLNRYTTSSTEVQEEVVNSTKAKVKLPSSSSRGRTRARSVGPPFVKKSSKEVKEVTDTKAQLVTTSRIYSIKLMTRYFDDLDPSQALSSP